MTEYTATTANATDTITATPVDETATVEISVGDDPVESGAAATWVEGDNTVTVEVTNGGETNTYTVTVTYEVPDSTLSDLTIGVLTLDPEFDPAVTTYATTTSNAQNKVTATPTDANATVAITVDDVAVENDSSVTWGESGDHEVVVTVTNGTESTVYTVTVTN